MIMRAIRRISEAEHTLSQRHVHTNHLLLPSDLCVFDHVPSSLLHWHNVMWVFFLFLSELAHEEAFFEDDYTADYSAADEHHENFPELDDNHPINFDDASKNTSDANHTENKHSSSGSAKTETGGSNVVAVKPEEAQESAENAAPTASEEPVKGNSSESNKRDEEEVSVSPET